MKQTIHPELPAIRRSIGLHWPSRFPPRYWWVRGLYSVIAISAFFVAQSGVQMIEELEMITASSRELANQSARAIADQNLKISRLEGALVACINGGNLTAEGTFISCREAETIR